MPTAGIMGWLTATIGFLALAVCARPGPEGEKLAKQAIPLALACVLGMFAGIQLTTAGFAYRSDIAIWLLLCGLAVLYAARKGVPTLHECRTRVLPVVMLGFLVVSVRTIRNDPRPLSDVFMLQQASAEAMVKLRNPYTASIPNIYGPGSPYYIPLTRNGRTLYGLGYPPLIAVLNLPAYLLTGDVRYGQMLALLISCGLLALMRTSWLALCGGVLLLINPFSLPMIEYAWIEPTVILILCLTLYSVSRYPKAVPYLFGLFLSSKQTNLAILPLAWMLVDRAHGWKGLLNFLGKSLAVTVAISLPFYLWNPDAFMLSLVTVQLHVPMRADLISFAAYAASKGWFVLPSWFSFLYLPIGIYLGLWKTRRSEAGFAAASAMLLIPFFAFSKQGSPNYFFLGFGMLCCALALTNVSVPPGRSRRPTDPDLLEHPTRTSD